MDAPTCVWRGCIGGGCRGCSNDCEGCAALSHEELPAWLERMGTSSLEFRMALSGLLLECRVCEVAASREFYSRKMHGCDECLSVCLSVCRHQRCMECDERTALTRNPRLVSHIMTHICSVVQQPWRCSQSNHVLGLYFSSLSNLPSPQVRQLYCVRPSPASIFPTRCSMSTPAHLPTFKRSDVHLLHLLTPCCANNMQECFLQCCAGQAPAGHRQQAVSLSLGHRRKH
jgi:hypothetical protein